MSENVPLEVVLPIAKDLYLQVVRPKVPSDITGKPDPIEQRMTQVADEFASFTLQIYRKLSAEKK